MIDSVVRPLLERLHRPLAGTLGSRVHPNVVSLLGLLFGIGCAAALLSGWRWLALVLWIMNRSADGLDGTLARSSGRQSDFGGYLDIMLDFLIYAIIPIALVAGLPREQQALTVLPLAAMLASFYVNAASWMYPAALLEKRGRVERTSTSIIMPSGLIEATETMVFYCVLIALPGAAAGLMWTFAALVLATAGQRLVWGYHNLR